MPASSLFTDETHYIEVALPLPLRQTFTYSCRAELVTKIKPGARVSVPFGKRTLVGYVAAIHSSLVSETELDPKKIKGVVAVLDDEPLVSPEILELTRWTADYYANFWGEMLKASLPAGINSGGVRAKRRKAVRIIEGAESDKTLTTAQEQIIHVLSSQGGEMFFTDLLEAVDASASPLHTLARRGLVEIFVADDRRDPLARASIPAPTDFDLTSEQHLALDEIISPLALDNYQAFLLHGVTGSGKTEVYIRAMQRVLESGRSSLMLVPEIALTPVFSRRLRSVFRSEVAILHSNLSAGERFDEWNRIRRGDARIAIGTRSAVFAPLENLGLLIVDEEHDTSYRQHESPFYNARDVAVMRAHNANAVVVLGSATPSLESYFNARSGKYTLLSMPTRIGEQGLADAEIVDMREVFRRFGKDVALSPELIDSIRETHSRGEQSIIFLNRRGFSQFVLCRSCGETIKCKNCDISLTFHRSRQELVCHYCSHREPSPSICPQCQSKFLYFVGEGTENLADQLIKKFPEMRIARVDRDAMTRKGELDSTLMSFAAGEIDMLVGTQMIAKGHDFPNVTLVGVVSVDIGLGLPDLRSAERTFQLITQVAGRAGRGAKRGRVLIQTYYPEHYALRHAVAQDYEGFYGEEIRFRERLGYPPMWVLAVALIKHRDLKTAMANANLLRNAIDRHNAERAVRVLGPAPASLSRLKNEFRVQIVLKSQSRKQLRSVLDAGIADAERRGLDSRSVFVEIDPINLM